MLRKTVICVAGVIAGVSAGAYSSGFFNEDNFVTTAYKEVMDRVGLEGVGLQEVADTSMSDASDAGEYESLASTGFGTSQSGIDNDVFAESSDTASASVDVPGSNSVSLAQELLAANNIRRSSKTRPLDMEDGSQSRRKVGDVAAASTDEAKSVLKDTMPEKTELSRKRAEPKRADRKRAEQDRVNAEQARIQAELEQAQAVVEARFSKEIYKSSTGETLNYRKLVPSNPSEDKLYPLVVFLHGKGERGSDNELQLKHGLKLFADDEGMKRFPAIVIAPQCPEDQLWSTTVDQRDATPSMDPQPTPAMRLVIELLDSMLLTDSVDLDRIYVTGLSMGGFGTFDLVTRRPTLFAAAAPVCGGGDPTKLKRLLNMPIWVVHGTDDEVVNINRSREMVYALESAGATPRYSELKGFGHNVWDATYGDIELYNWMFSQSKKGATKKGATKKRATKKGNPARSIASSPKAIDRRPTNASRKNPSRPISPRASAQSLPQRKQPANVNPRLEPMLGNWKVLAASQRGRQANKAALEKMFVTFEGDRFTIQLDDRQEITRFRLGDTRNAQQIDFVSNRKGVADSAGIFEINGDKMIICWGEPGGSRPTRFVNSRNVKSLVLQKQ